MPSTRVKNFFTAFVFVIVAACSIDDSGTAAPIGDVKTLEKLAQSYRKISQQFDNSPQQLPPSERKRFVEFIFRDAGFSYDKTLAAMATTDLDPNDQNQKDLMELMFFPHRGIAANDIDGIYSREELHNIKLIQEAMQQ